MSDIIRYPGRACLLGEHCDWAGGSSLTVPLPLGVQVEVEAGLSDIRAQSELHGRLLEGSWPVKGLVNTSTDPLRLVGAAAHCLTEQGLQLQPCLLRYTSTLPAGRGFSSSAAFCLATLDGLARAAGHHLEAAQLAELAYQTEHGLLGIACGRQTKPARPEPQSSYDGQTAKPLSPAYAPARQPFCSSGRSHSRETPIAS